MNRLKKVWKIVSNLLLVGIVLVIFIPSWRFNFQILFQKTFMSDVVFETSITTPINNDFALFNNELNITNFQELKDKPTVISFWRTWCVPCRAELPELLKLKKFYKEKINVLAFTNEEFEVMEAAAVDVKNFDFIRYVPYPSEEFEVTAFPTIFLLNKELNIVSKIIGGGDLLNKENQALINSLLLD